MKRIIEELRNWGCNIDGAMDRFLNNEELYASFLKKTVDLPEFEILGEELKNKNATAAFNCAHTLKGVTGNMGLTPIYNYLVDITEPLRKGIVENLYSIYENIVIQKKYLEKLIEMYGD